MAKKKTSKQVASKAGNLQKRGKKLLASTDKALDQLVVFRNAFCDFINDVDSVAGSAISQREKK